MRTKSWIALSFLVVMVKSKLQPLPDEFSLRMSISNCVTEASSIFFVEGDIVAVALAIKEVAATKPSAVVLDRIMFTNMFSRYKVTLTMRKLIKPMVIERFLKTIDNYVIQIRYLEEIGTNLDVLVKDSSWNPHARFLVITATVFPNNTETAAHIIKELWMRKVTNGVVLLPAGDENSTLEAYSWFPFNNGLCGAGYDQMELIDKCRFGTFENGKPWYPDKVPKNVRGCTISVRTVVWPPYVLPPERKIEGTKNQYEFKEGLETKIMNSMAQMENITLVYTLSDKPEDFGYILPNGSAGGNLAVVKNMEVDLAISSYGASLERHKYFDTVPYDFPESLIWCVPHTLDNTQWKKLFMVLGLYVWVLLFVVYIIVCFLLWLIGRKKTDEALMWRTLSGCLLNIVSLMVGISVSEPPRTRHLRYFFMLWVFFSMHLYVGYQTVLVGMFTTSKEAQSITTIHDIIASNLKMWFLPESKRFFQEGEDAVSKTVIDRWNDCFNVKECLKEVVIDRSAAMCVPRLYMKYVISSYEDKHAINSMIYCFKDNVVTYPLEIVLWKGFPFTNRFGLLVQSISAAGLTSLWERNIFDFGSEEGGGNEGNRLSLSHLQSPFMFLLFAQIISLLVFIGELIVYKINSRKQRKTKMLPKQSKRAIKNKIM